MMQQSCETEGACDDFDRDLWWLPQQDRRHGCEYTFASMRRLQLGITDLQL
jgi:hypothetical protein